MRIAYILYNGITTLDFIGIYDPVSRLRSMGFLPDLSWQLCALQASIKDHIGLEITVDAIRPDLGGYDAIVVPGGFGSRTLQQDEDFIDWLQTAGKDTLKISICTGSLLLGAAGFLEGKRATSHFAEYRQLETYANEVLQERIVEDRGVITAGAVAASLDLGLYLCEKWAGKQAMDEIAKSMNYKLVR
ncbi:MAG: DJ-1/PfpI family protein [Flavobacteriaceae bacterium]